MAAISDRTKNVPRKSSRPERIIPHAINRKDLEEMLTFAKGLARASGALALSYYGRANPTLKYDHDLVTETDLKIQDYIQKEVKSAYPDHRFLGEESRARKISCKDELDEPIWVVDPVDGSASFSAGLPVWGVSIALFESQKPILGVFYQPVTAELYSATSSGKAMLNDRQISVRDETVDNESLLLTYSRFHRDFVTSFPGKVRSLGSTVSHLTYVARGAACGAVLGNVHVWDVAAGMVILEAAGGSVRDLGGKKVDLSLYLGGEKINRVLIASAKGQHQSISEALQSR